MRRLCVLCCVITHPVVRIPDPDATKPEDWDEDAPRTIVDEDAKKPEDWLEDEEQYIADPEAKKPEDWDDEEDGEWVAPQIRKLILYCFSTAYF